MLVSGMIIGTVFTLFVVPSVYVLVARTRQAVAPAGARAAATASAVSPRRLPSRTDGGGVYTLGLEARGLARSSRSRQGTEEALRTAVALAHGRPFRAGPLGERGLPRRSRAPARSLRAARGHDRHEPEAHPVRQAEGPRARHRARHPEGHVRRQAPRVRAHRAGRVRRRPGRGIAGGARPKPSGPSGRFRASGSRGPRRSCSSPGYEPSLAPESNGLRVLVRLGLVRDGGSYARTYAASRAGRRWPFRRIRASCKRPICSSSNTARPCASEAFRVAERVRLQGGAPTR